MDTHISTGVSRIFLVVLLAVAAIILIVWFRNQIPVGGPTITVSNGAVAKKPAVSTSFETVQEVDSIAISDVDKEFRAIDGDINAL
ncbi:hypothetical protein HY250_00835 [Candidatus Azambacteria bacterium]|nr:hypothetical protein [Candidatus Azambacteria bacterium]MBI3684938.1 hypothetical protein [Candidatus Azambacteria bacterium]